jgi:hypothetical protein
MQSKKGRIGLIADALVIGSIVLSGCADSSSAIQPASSSRSYFDYSRHNESVTLRGTPPGVEEYRVFDDGGTSLGSIEAVRARAEKNATEFCARTGKVMIALRETIATPPYTLHNTPRIEIIFGCVERGSP